MIVDIQYEFIEKTNCHNEVSNIHKLHDFENHILNLITWAKNNKLPILLIRMENKGPVLNRVVQSIDNYKNTIKLDKNANNALGPHDFYFDIINHIRSLNLNKLIIAGANGSACISRTIEGADEHNITIYTSSDLVIDFNTDDFEYPFVNWTVNFDNLEHEHFFENQFRCLIEKLE